MQIDQNVVLNHVKQQRNQLADENAMLIGAVHALKMENETLKAKAAEPVLAASDNQGRIVPREPR